MLTQDSETGVWVPSAAAPVAQLDADLPPLPKCVAYGIIGLTGLDPNDGHRQLSGVSVGKPGTWCKNSVVELYTAEQYRQGQREVAMQYVERIRHLERELAASKLAPMCEHKTDHIMQRDGYEKTGYVLKKAGERICVSDGGAVAWFTLDQWNWLMFNRDHVEFNWPKPYGHGRTAGTASEAAPEAVSVMLWLYRRLPRCYGRPPHVEGPITALAKIAGVSMKDVSESFAERGADPSAAAPSTQEGAKCPSD